MPFARDVRLRRLKRSSSTKEKGTNPRWMVVVVHRNAAPIYLLKIAQAHIGGGNQRTPAARVAFFTCQPSERTGNVG